MKCTTIGSEQNLYLPCYPVKPVVIIIAYRTGGAVHAQNKADGKIKTDNGRTARAYERERDSDNRQKLEAHSDIDGNLRDYHKHYAVANH